MKTFEEWLNETEGYSLKKERAYDELVEYEHGSYTARWNMVLDWLQAAFEAGVESQKNTLDSYKREVRMLREELTEAIRIKKMLLEMDNPPEFKK